MNNMYELSYSKTDWSIENKPSFEDYTDYHIEPKIRSAMTSDWFLQILKQHIHLKTSLQEQKQGSPERLLDLFETLDVSEDFSSSVTDVIKWSKKLPHKEIKL